MYLFLKKRRLERNTATRKQYIKEKINLYMYNIQKRKYRVTERKNKVKNNESNGNNEIKDNRRIEDKTQRTFQEKK